MGGATDLDSPLQQLTLLGQVLGCGTCFAKGNHQVGVSIPTPRSKPAAVPDAPDFVEPEDPVEDDVLAMCAAQSSTAVAVSPEVLCPTHEAQMQIFDDYEFLAALGSGAFGKVLRVRQRQTGQMRACKAVSASTSLERSLVQTEMALLTALNHPHVVRLLEVYVEPGEQRQKVYLITELCEGGDLLFRIAYHYHTLRVPMTEGHVAFMMRQILSAAMYCHHRGIVHRDIKPDNILFVDPSAGSPLKLIDFGLAGFADRLREAAREVSVPRSNSLARLARVLPKAGAKWCHVRKQMMQRAGTTFYMAPEMIQAGFYDQKADMFSIGVVFCELLAGWHPFHTPQVDDPQAVHAKITAPRPVRLPEDKLENISEEAKDLCRRLLEKDPRRRLGAGQALAHPWFRDPSLPSLYGNTNTGALGAPVFEGLRQYQEHHKLRRAALQVLSRNLAESQVQELRDAFMALDVQGDGLLSAEEIAEGARRADITLGEGEPEAIVSALGGASGLRAGYKEFIAALAERHVEFELPQLRECFQRLDTQNAGQITYRDMVKVLDPGGSEAPAISEAEWEEIVAPCGRQRDNRPAVQQGISFDEFVAMMRAPPGSCAPDDAEPSLALVHVHDAEPAPRSPGTTSRLWRRCSEPLCC